MCSCGVRGLCDGVGSGASDNAAYDLLESLHCRGRKEPAASAASAACEGTPAKSSPCWGPARHEQQQELQGEQPARALGMEENLAALRRVLLSIKLLSMGAGPAGPGDSGGWVGGC